MDYPDYPLVSIIVPVFNRADVLRETIESITGQTYQNWESIFVDDHSTDGSLEIISDFVEKDPRCRLIKRNRTPKGASTCRNIGLENSKGKYIIFLDSDDIFTPTCIENRVKTYATSPSMDFLVFPMGHFSSNPGESMKTWKITDREDSEEDLDRFLKKDWHLMIGWLTTSPIWKKEALLRLHGFDEALPDHQDYDLHVRAIIEGLRYKKIDTTPDWFYRMNNSNKISKNRSDIRTLKERTKLFSRIHHLLNRRGLVTNNRMRFLHIQFENIYRTMVINNHRADANSMLKGLLQLYENFPLNLYLITKLYLKGVLWSIKMKRK